MRQISRLYNPANIFLGVSLLIFSITVASRLLFNGYIYDFDYHLYQPDGAVYTFITLKWLGLSDGEAAQQVINWYKLHAEAGNTLTPTFFDPASNPGVWSLASYRFLYSFLSAPFVYLLGIPGMLVIPIAALGFIFFCITYKAWRSQNYLIGTLCLALLSWSPTVTRWFVANITDGLLASLFATLLIFNLTKRGKIRYPLFLLLILLTSFTRFCTPFWYAIAFVYFFRKEKKLALFILLFSSICVLPTLLSKPDPNSIVVGATGGIIGKLLYFPISAAKILFIEVAQLAAIDRALLALLAIAFLASIRDRSKFSSQLFLAFSLAGWFIGALNGVLGVNFRYQLPLIAIGCWVIIDSVKLSTNWSFRHILKVKT